MTYATYNEIIARYPAAADIGEASVNSNFLFFAENEINGLLGRHFTAPFSDNNITVKDLTIELSLIRIYTHTSPSEAKRRRDIFDKKISNLIEGEEVMLLTDGSQITSSVGGTVYSTTSGYTPIFGFSEIEDSEIDPDLLDDEEDARL